MSILSLDDSDDDIVIGDDDLLTGYRRSQLKREPWDDDVELSDYVKTRLLLARLKALQKYNEIKGTA